MYIFRCSLFRYSVGRFCSFPWYQWIHPRSGSETPSGSKGITISVLSPGADKPECPWRMGVGERSTGHGACQSKEFFGEGPVHQHREVLVGIGSYSEPCCAASGDPLNDRL